jgi:general secretion pathway protein D
MGGAPGGDTASTLSQTIRMEGEKIVLQFPNNPVMDMLSIYELLTGVTLIKDTSILEGAPVSLATPRAVEKAEAIKLIEATLLTNGYAIVMEADGKSARILPARSQGANAVQFSHGVKFYTSAQDLPVGETIVTYFMKLDNLDPETAGTMLSGHVGLGVYGRITPVLVPPGLLITESSTVVKQLISIREAIDIAASAASLVTKFIPLEHADAATVAQIIQATLSAQAEEKESKGVNTIRGNAASDGRKEDNNNSSSRDSRDNAPRVNPVFINGQWVIPNSPSEPATTAQVIADTRLNQILIVASTADYTYIASMIAEFDKPLKIDVPYERKLKYAAAVDVMAAVVDLLTEPTGGTTALPGGGSLQSQRQQSFASTSSQLLGGRTTTGTRGGQVLSTSGGGADDTASATSGIGSRADLIQGPSEDNAPISVLVGKTRVVADPMANSILVVGRTSEIEKVNGLLDKLDRRPSQVYLATVIGQLTLDDGFEFGIDYLTKVNNQNGDKTNFTAGNFVSNRDLFNRVPDVRTNLANAIPGVNGLNLYGAIGSGVEAFVSALETTDRFKVLSRPSVFALNNKKAVITSGTLIPVPAQTVQNLNANNAGTFTTTIEYRDVVLKLEVVPLINEDGEVNLTIAQINDTVIDTTVIANNTVPIIATEQIVTSVNVRDRNTIVLGGLISETKDNSTSGTPFLSRVPGVGHLFKRTNNSLARKELIIFIQPTVVTSENDMRISSAKEDYRTKIGADVAERFPEEVNIQAVRTSDEFDQAAGQKKKGFFNRIFTRDGNMKKAPPPPSLRR